MTNLKILPNYVHLMQQYFNFLIIFFQTIYIHSELYYHCKVCTCSFVVFSHLTLFCK